MLVCIKEVNGNPLILDVDTGDAKLMNPSEVYQRMIQGGIIYSYSEVSVVGSNGRPYIKRSFVNKEYLLRVVGSLQEELRCSFRMYCFSTNEEKKFSRKISGVITGAISEIEIVGDGNLYTKIISILRRGHDEYSNFSDKYLFDLFMRYFNSELSELFQHI